MNHRKIKMTKRGVGRRWERKKMKGKMTVIMRRGTCRIRRLNRFSDKHKRSSVALSLPYLKPHVAASRRPAKDTKGRLSPMLPYD